VKQTATFLHSLTIVCVLAADEASARPAPREALGPKVLDAASRVLQQLRTLKVNARKYYCCMEYTDCLCCWKDSPCAAVHVYIAVQPYASSACHSCRMVCVLALQLSLLHALKSGTNSGLQQRRTTAY
jgi:hypothetical protein